MTSDQPYTQRLQAGSDSDKTTLVRVAYEQAETVLREALPEGRRKGLALNALEVSANFAHKSALE